jgi:hypothetical protein
VVIRAGGPTQTIRLRVKVRGTANVGSVTPFSVTATSDHDGAMTDILRARVKAT